MNEENADRDSTNPLGQPNSFYIEPAVTNSSTTSTEIHEPFGDAERRSEGRSTFRRSFSFMSGRRSRMTGTTRRSRISTIAMDVASEAEQVPNLLDEDYLSNEERLQESESVMAHSASGGDNFETASYPFPLGEDSEQILGDELLEGNESDEDSPFKDWPTCREFPKWYWKRLTGFDQSLDSFGFYPNIDIIYSFFFVCISLVIFALIDHYGFYPLKNHQLQGFIPAFGASCTVVFGIPKAPISQPRNVVISHITAAIIGTALTNAFRPVKRELFGQHCAGAIGVGLHMVLMMLTNTMHPPASATVVSAAVQVMNAYYKDEGFLFVILPCLYGPLLIVALGLILNNLIEDRSPYPQFW